MAVNLSADRAAQEPDGRAGRAGGLPIGRDRSARAAVPALVMAAALVSLAAPVSAAAPVSPPASAADGRAAYMIPRGARTISAGQLTPDPAPDAPPEMDLRALTLDRAPAGLAARVRFGGPFRQLSTLGGRPVQHVVFVTLRPPTGDVMRVLLGADGRGAVERSVAGRFVRVGPGTARIEGDSVLFEVPPSMEVGPDWGIQAHVLLTDSSGGLFHNHSQFVTVAALTGEGAAATVPLTTQGDVVEGGSDEEWRRADVPPPARPVSMRGEPAGSTPTLVVGFAAAPAPVSEIGRRPVTTQGVDLLFASGPDAIGAPVVVSWNARSGQASALDAADPAKLRDLGPVTVAASGTELRFDLTELLPRLSPDELVSMYATVENDQGAGAAIWSATARLADLMPPTATPATPATAAAPTPPAPASRLPFRWYLVVVAGLGAAVIGFGLARRWASAG